MKFHEFTLDERILKAVDEAGFENCTKVQEETLKRTLNGIDVCVQAQTGTGKTAAFLISIFEIFCRNLKEGKKSKAAIIAPTRELALQIEEEASILGKYLGFKTACFFGGVSYSKQEMQLSDGVDIYIGTPGRIIDYLKSKRMNFSDIDIFVLDEADRMFDMGFLPDIKFIMRKLPPKDKRMTLLFSATLAYKVRNIAWEYMNHPEEIDIEAESVVVGDIDQKLIHTSSDEKFKVLLGIVAKETPKNVIIFANTKNMVVELSKRLELNGYPNEYIIGDLPQNKRIKIINGIKSGDIKFLIGTDVAARGLHVDDLEMVINYDLPEDSESYVHRIGRTARAGKSGKAYSLACEKFVYHIESIEKYIEMQIPVVWIEDDFLQEDKSVGVRIESYYQEKDRKKRDSDKMFSGSQKRKPRPGQKDRRKPSESGDFDKRKQFKKKGHGSKPREEKESSDFKTPKTYNAGENSTKRNKPPYKKKIKNNKSVENRLEYYKEKYGEDFKVVAQTGPAAKESKKGVLGRVAGKLASVFKKK